MKVAVSKVPLYPTHLVVMVVENWPQAVTFFSEQDDHGIKIEDLEKHNAVCIPNGKIKTKDGEKHGVYIVFNSSIEMSFGLVAHEVAHATNAVFELISEQVLTYNDEAYCYLTQWITETVYKTLQMEFTLPLNNQP